MLSQGGSSGAMDLGLFFFYKQETPPELKACAVKEFPLPNI
ncbi:MAG TPA: hypothetical protein VIQ51_08955 [Chryseosolibacter sp.]